MCSVSCLLSPVFCLLFSARLRMSSEHVLRRGLAEALAQAGQFLRFAQRFQPTRDHRGMGPVCGDIRVGILSHLS